MKIKFLFIPKAILSIKKPNLLVYIWTESNKFSLEELEMKFALIYARKTLATNVKVEKENKLIKVDVLQMDNAKTPYNGLFERYLPK